MPEKDTGSFDFREFIKSITLEKWKQHYAMAVKKSNMCKCGQNVQMMHQLALQACFKCSNDYKSRKIGISFEQTKKITPSGKMTKHPNALVNKGAEVLFFLLITKIHTQ